MIELKNVSKKFRIGSLKRETLLRNFLNILYQNEKEDIWALKNINLKIKDSENLAIIGPNGSGKSTLLKIISGILVPTSGTLNINTQITPFLQLGIGFHLDLTVKENVYLYGSILGKTRRYLSEKFKDIISFAQLNKFVNTKLKDLSSGMQSRLAFSIAVYSEPETLVLDEVLAVGDLEFKNKCLNVFENFKKNKKTIILTSHDLDLVTKFFDRCIYLKNGIIIADGDPKAVVNTYKNDINQTNYLK